jgi:beta-glucosidase
MEAKEVVQLYVSSKQSSVPRPKKELKAYKKINLEIGESKNITFKLRKEAFQFWSEETHSWQVDHGKYDIIIGNSDKNKELKETIEL